MKSQISSALSRETIPENMRLFIDDTGTKELPDNASVADYDSIKDDCILFLVFKDGGDSWEEIDVVQEMDEE